MYVADDLVFFDLVFLKEKRYIVFCCLDLLYQAPTFPWVNYLENKVNTIVEFLGFQIFAIFYLRKLDICSMYTF